MPSKTSAKNTLQIKEKALELGFLDCGIAPAKELSEDAARLESWLINQYHGDMQYMENHFAKRTDPSLLVEGSRSVIVVLQNYHNPEKQSHPGAPRISKYAYGKDYHKIVQKKLKNLLEFMQRDMGASGRCFVDSAPVLERALGRDAGLGWIGKNSLLLNRRNGSLFFIGTIITDLILKYDSPTREYCGDCNRCIEACPTGAIIADKIVDSRRCISYLTIENKKEKIPEEFRGKMENWIFGCDICQDVCPWNNNANPHNESSLMPLPELLEMSGESWQNLDEEKYNQLFEGSAVKRSKFSGLKRNIDFLKPL
jgi:epoxyqueuosine reductase